MDKFSDRHGHHYDETPINIIRHIRRVAGIQFKILNEIEKKLIGKPPKPTTSRDRTFLLKHMQLWMDLLRVYPGGRIILNKDSQKNNLQPARKISDEALDKALKSPATAAMQTPAPSAVDAANAILRIVG